MKKFLIALLSMIIFVTAAGCGQNDYDSKKVGTLTRLNLSSEKNDEIMNKYNSEHGDNNSQKTTYYDNINSMEMGLEAGQIEEIQTYGSVANYMKAKNEKLEVKTQTEPLYENFCCALRDDENNLRDEMNNAIESMKNDGTLERLTRDFIINLQADEEPPAVEISKIEGADTIKVGVTGDLPPLDLTLADGTPAGFNTAVLSEISKRINKNIQIVVIDSSARATALMSKKVDVIFWVVVPDDKNVLPADSDKPNGIELTSPYYRDQITNVTVVNALSGM